MIIQRMGIASAAATPPDPSSHSPAPSILAIETSCDETAAAVMRVDGVLLSSVLYSQHDVHQRYGGVVPELAARRHIETVESVVAQSMVQAHIEWSDVQAVAVTSGPGLAGALLVGVNMGKALAYARRVPLIAVRHLVQLVLHRLLGTMANASAAASTSSSASWHFRSTSTSQLIAETDRRA